MERPAISEFAERLKGAMKRADVKGKELAEMAGVTPNTVTDWRNGEYVPEGERLAKVAGALRVTEQWLVYGDRSAVQSAGLTRSELRGYAIAVRDMLENARILQQRVIDGLAADENRDPPILKVPRPPKDPLKVQKAVARHDVERPSESAPAEEVLPKKRKAGGT